MGYFASPGIRVAHLITSLNIGGAEQQLKQLVLARKGDDLRQQLVISMTDEGPIGAELRQAGVKVHTLGIPRGRPSLSGLFRLSALLGQLRPEVVHCWLYHACLLGVVAGRIAKTPKVVWSLQSANESLASYRFQTRLVVRLCASLSRFVDAISPNSEVGRALHERWGYSMSRMCVIPNGIDLNLFKPDPEAYSAVRKELGVPSQTLLIGLFARYHPMKDHATFLRAAQIVRSQTANVQFLLAGEGITANNTELCRIVDECGLEEVIHRLGARSDVPRLTAAVDVACLSSWSESAPFVVCEAMACGVPCVVTNVGDAAQMVGDAGSVVPVRDPDALANALSRLLTIPKAQRAALGWRAREFALKYYSIERAAIAYEAVYAQKPEKQAVRSQQSVTHTRNES